MIIGIIVGALGGYFKGIISDVVLGVIQIFFVIPALLLILLFARIFLALVFKGLGLTLIVLILSFFGWSGTAFIVDGETLRVREMDFVQAARSLGAGSSQVAISTYRTQHPISSDSDYNTGYCWFHSHRSSGKLLRLWRCEHYNLGIDAE